MSSNHSDNFRMHDMVGAGQNQRMSISSAAPKETAEYASGLGATSRGDVTAVFCAWALPAS